jgi:hypothetical protein
MAKETMMATFDSKEIVDQIIGFNGERDPEDPPGSPVAVKVVEYTNAWGKRCWGVVYRAHGGIQIENEMRYEQVTDTVRDPVVIWQVED